MAPINVCLLAILIVSVAACDGTSEQEPASSRNSESLQFSRNESYQNDSIRRVDNSLGETLKQTTWFYQGRPLMRTRWQSDGYGHLYEFTASGHLIGISEAIYGVKHGYECHLDAFGHIVNVKHFVDGEETDGEPETKRVEPTDPEVDVEEYYAESDTGMYLQLRIYTRQDQVIETHRFLPDGSLAFWMSMVPFTSPIVMMMRIPFGVPAWQLALSMVLLVGGFLFTSWVAGRIYRIGILMHGTKVNYKVLAKWFATKN